MDLPGGSRVERVVLYGTRAEASDLGTRRRAVVLLLSLVAAAAFVALLGLVWPEVPKGDVELEVSNRCASPGGTRLFWLLTVLEQGLLPLPQYHGGSSWASEKLSHLDSTDAGWLGTGDDVKLQPLPSYNPDDDAGLK